MVYTQLTEEDDSARVTITLDEIDHRFTVSQDGEKAVIEYEESNLGRSGIEVSEPPEEVWQSLATSDELTSWLESRDLTGVRFDRKR